MSNTTSHIETIREALEDARTVVGNTFLINAALASLEALSRQPAQEGKALSQKLRDLREHLPTFGSMDGTVWMLLDECISLAEELESQPVQTEDLEAKAREWWESEEVRAEFQQLLWTVEAEGKRRDRVLASFYRFMQARSLSEHK